MAKKSGSLKSYLKVPRLGAVNRLDNAKNRRLLKKKPSYGKRR